MPRTFLGPKYERHVVRSQKELSFGRNDKIRLLIEEGKGVTEICDTMPGYQPEEVWGVRKTMIDEGAEIVSPYGMVQERVAKDELYPWRIIVTCSLMNRTHARQVRPIMKVLFDMWPNAWCMARASPNLEDLIRGLGFVNRRSTALRAMSSDYANGTSPAACRGVGEFGQDALKVFVDGNTSIHPRDGFLGKYLDWIREGKTR